MVRLLVAVTLVVGSWGCHRRTTRDDAGAATPALAVSVLPALPAKGDPAQAMREIDEQIANQRSLPLMIGPLITALLERASIRGRLEDYADVVALSKRWIDDAPTSAEAWKSRVTTLGRVHKFADARAALETWSGLAGDRSEYAGLVATLDEATGHYDRSAPYRERRAKEYVHSTILTQWAASLAVTGHVDDAIAIIPRAAAELRNASPNNVAWMLFQWGRLYEQKGEMSAARQFYEEAHRRFPPALEPAVHLAQTMAATGGDPSAMVAAAVAENPHPELLALAGKLPEARAAWERYLAAFPEAFSDHAARFFLGPGRDPARALALAHANLAVRDTPEARALVVETALAASDPTAACAVVEPLVTGLRPHQFLAWRALSACGRSADADRLATTLGIQ